MCQTNQPWACGKAGGACRACAPGQSCDGTCVGDRANERILVQGNNAFIPLSAQAYRVTRPRPEATNFIALSNVEHDTCRDPFSAPAAGERVFIFSELNGTVDAVVLVSPGADGGVRRDVFNNSSGTSFGQGFARADISVSQRGIVLVGTIEAPYCGDF
ncbi:MAG: hypothetical protein QM817_35950 [Archangium sp.]